MNLERPRIEARDRLIAATPDLARQEPFRLGTVHVVPAMRRLDGSNEGSIVVEPLVMQVLVSLARAQGHTLSRDDLVRECWGRRFVGDDAVNRVISRLRRSLATVSGGEVSIKTIAKVGYRLNVTADFAEADMVDVPATDATKKPRRRAAGVLVASASLLAILGMMTLGKHSATAIAIAIEPIQGIGSDVLSSQLAANLTTDVASLTGSMTQLTLIEPGAATRADMKLEVTYSGPASGEDARLRLVDTDKGAVLWSRAFEATGVSPALVRERAAYAIAGVIRCGLDKSTGNLGDPVSKRLYFAACDAVEARDWPRALSFAQQIARLRPDSAASWACLAMTTVYVASEESIGRAKAANDSAAYARKALVLDPHSGLAHQALAMALEMQGRPNFEALEQGAKLDPEHAGLLASYSRGLFAHGFVRDSLEPATRSIALEPNDFGLTQNAIYDLMGAGRVMEARELQSKAERLWPDHRASLVKTGNALLFYADDARAALSFFNRTQSDHSDSELPKLELQWRVAPDQFDWTAFDRAAERQYASNPRNVWPIVLSAVRMNDTKRAFAWLAKSTPDPVGQQWLPLFWPNAAELRRDPRFFAQMAGLGLVTYWQSHGRWPDFCSDPKLRYDCRREAERLKARGKI